MPNIDSSSTSLPNWNGTAKARWASHHRSPMATVAGNARVPTVKQQSLVHSAGGRHVVA
jgi:hypothetical protein